jgi:glutathione S-transferase
MEAEAARPKLKLYKADWCGYCVRVMRVLDKLGLDYDAIEVPIPHSQRRDVLAISGQAEVPVLVDGDIVIDDDDRIIPYLEATYGKKS